MEKATFPPKSFLPDVFIPDFHTLSERGIFIDSRV
jgi:hypothetical protein